MKVLIIGGGGREHALCWKVSQNPKVKKIYCAPGNAGTGQIAQNMAIAASDINALLDFALKNTIDLTIVGPEEPLTLGIVDVFQEKGLRIFGPGQKASMIEGSKIFAKNIMREAGIPTADFAVFSNPAKASEYVKKRNCPLVVKADGLAAGKGVFPSRDASSAIEAINRIMVKKEFGSAGEAVVIEDFLEGEEASFICVTDGKSVISLPSSQDHKPVFDGDKGPNTGGMGAYSPAPVVTDILHDEIIKTVINPLIKTLSSKGIAYKGVIYAGLMIKGNKPQVLEFNVRLGDPETQPILMRLKTDFVNIAEAAIDGKLNEIDIEISNEASVCVIMASDGYPGDYEKGFVISGIDTAQNVHNTMVFHSGTKLSGSDVLTNGGRVLGVTSLGRTVEEAIDRVYEAVSKISWQKFYYRKDIAKKALNR